MKKSLAFLLSIFMMVSLAACGAESTEPEETETLRDGSLLIVYFSRWGNTEYPDDVDATTSASIVADGENYGTTEYVARMIQENVGGDLHLIRTQEPYPTDFDELRDLNHEEMAEDYLPALVESDLDISGYDTVFIGYPVWATAVPQAVLSFLNEYDLSGKTVIPFCTHDGYGAGGSYSTIREASHAAESPDGLAIEAKDVPSAGDTVASWLESIGMTGESSEAENAEAEENLTGGGNTFHDGDITYCEAHHNMAIFYAQTDDPVLSVDVIPIGRVTSDLSVFEELNSREEITFSLAVPK